MYYRMIEITCIVIYESSQFVKYAETYEYTRLRQSRAYAVPIRVSVLRARCQELKSPKSGKLSASHVDTSSPT